MSKPSLFVPLGVFALLAMLLAAGFGLDDPHHLPSALIGKPMPEFELVDVLNPDRVIRKEDLLGHVSLINVWATWCPNCVVEHPQFLEISRQGSIRVIGVNYHDDIEKAQQWLQKYENPYWVSVADTEGTLGIDLGVYGAPETFVMDAKGYIRYRHVGPVTRNVWLDTLLPVVDAVKREQVEQTAARG
ncbi:MAG: DsbE family thiol:disulfide interchange protein [Gammaproteobacteria bacterium]|nr:DsbE family thiol:disulfide interchange protein [Gammaproteobacteria bacterium]